MTSVTKLSLCGCRKITDKVARYLGVLAALRDLDWGCCLQITDVGVHHLTSLRLLTKLTLYGCKNIKDRSVRYFGAFAALRHLDLTYCLRIPGVFSIDLTSLKVLDLSHCSGITDKGISHMKILVALR